jgi:hypothetical protein
MFIISLLIALIVGATLSYVWTMGYYASPEFRLPEKGNITIENVVFPPQNTTVFNVTVLNPSYSQSNMEISQIVVLTNDGILHEIRVQGLPYLLEVGRSRTFSGFWNWAGYIGQTAKVFVFVTEGSGANALTEVPPYAKLTMDAYFNSSVSVRLFNVTVQNVKTSAEYATYVDITELAVNGETIENVTVGGESVSFPYFLNSSESVVFTCAWDWTNKQGESVTIAVYTSQGYMARISPTLPEPVILEITDVLFDPSNTSVLSVNIQNNETSPSFVSINKMSITMENETTVEISNVSPLLTPPFVLRPNSSETFILFWNWTYYRNQTVQVTAHTLQGFTVQSAPELTPPLLILEITDIAFGPANTTFNMTLLNSQFSIKSANITRITVTLENGTVVEIVTVDPPLPQVLGRGESLTFTCTFEWFKYLGMNVTVIAYTEEGFEASMQSNIPTA